MTKVVYRCSKCLKAAGEMVSVGDETWMKFSGRVFSSAIFICENCGELVYFEKSEKRLERLLQNVLNMRKDRLRG